MRANHQVIPMPRTPLHKRSWPQRKIRLPPAMLENLEALAKQRGVVLEDVVAEQLRRADGTERLSLPPAALLFGDAVAHLVALAIDAHNGAHPWTDAATRASVGHALRRWGQALGGNGETLDGARVLELIDRLGRLDPGNVAAFRAAIASGRKA